MICIGRLFLRSSDATTVQTFRAKALASGQMEHAPFLLQLHLNNKLLPVKLQASSLMAPKSIRITQSFSEGPVTVTGERSTDGNDSVEIPSRGGSCTQYL